MDGAKVLEVWTAQSLCGAGILCSVVSFVFYLARPRFDKAASQQTLRIASETILAAGVILRDGFLLAAVLLGLFHLNLDLMADIKVGLPFVPLATVLLAGALFARAYSGGGARNNRWVFALVSGGALFNLVGFTLVMEAPGSEYSSGSIPFWTLMKSWRSNLNPGMATWVFWACFCILLVMGGAAAILTFRDLCRPFARGAAQE